MLRIKPIHALMRVVSDAADVLLLRSHRVQGVSIASWRWNTACVLFAGCSGSLILLQTASNDAACVVAVLAFVAPYLWVLPYRQGSDDRTEMTRRGYCTVAASTVIVALSFLPDKAAVVAPTLLAAWLVVASAAVFLSGGRRW